MFKINSYNKKTWYFIGVFFLVSSIFALSLPAQSIVSHLPSLIPSILTIAIVFITRKVIFGLFVGLWFGAVLFEMSKASSSFEVIALIKGSQNVFAYFFANIEQKDNLLIILFIALILALTSVMTISGGFAFLGQWIFQRASSRKKTQIFTVIGGFIIFIDDYINTIIVGSQMRPLSDKFLISREKLAFLVDATSAPVAGIAVVSTWIGYEAGLFQSVLQDAGLIMNGYAVVLEALPYRFYCIMMLIFVVLLVTIGKDFGPMRKAEARATRGQLLDSNAKLLLSKNFTLLEPKPSIVLSGYTLFGPIIVLFMILFGGFLVDSGGFDRVWNEPYLLLRGDFWRWVITHTKHNKEIMALSAGLSLIVSILLGKMVAKALWQNIFQAVYAGLRSALLPALILFLAWSLKSVFKDLQTGSYLMGLFQEVLSLSFLPLVAFFLGAMISFLTGTSYGTMAILLPLVGPMALQMEGIFGMYTLLTMAAVLDGSILGDHASPLSDTTIMTSISCACDPMHHVKTQLPYASYVGLAAAILGYVSVSAGLSSLLAYFLFVAITVSLFMLIQAFRKKNCH